MAQGFDLFGQLLDLFLPLGAFRLLLLPVQNLALAGKLFDLILQIALVGLHIGKSLQAAFPQKMCLLLITVEFLKILAQQKIAAFRGFAVVGFAQQGAVAIIASHKPGYLAVRFG